jgi:hypothetical protein
LLAVFSRGVRCDAGDKHEHAAVKEGVRRPWITKLRKNPSAAQLARAQGEGGKVSGVAAAC